MPKTPAAAPPWPPLVLLLAVAPVPEAGQATTATADVSFPPPATQQAYQTDKLPWSGLAPLATVTATDDSSSAAGPLRMPAAFWARSWEHEPVHVRGGAPGGAFSDAAVEELLASAEFELGRNARVALDGRFGTPASAGRRRLDSAALREYHDMRATVVLSSVEKSWPPVTALAAEVERWTGVPTTAALFRTPPRAQGSPAHFDMEDVFILQTAGSKRWRVWAPDPAVAMTPLPVSDPRTDYLRSKDYVPSLRPRSVEMLAGDLLCESSNDRPHAAIARAVV